MELTPASRYSIEELVEVYNQTRADYLIPMPMTTGHLRDYVDVYDVDLDASVVMMNSDQMLGLCLVGLRGERAWITRLGVLPDARRLGCGETMVDACLERARALGARQAQIEVIADNIAAHYFFEQAGFHDARRLLVLRRLAGTRLPAHQPPDASVEWLEGSAALAVVAQRPWTPAWTNELQSLANAGSMQALTVDEPVTARRGWVCFKRTAARLERVIIGPGERDHIPPAYTLLYHLHDNYPAYESVIENLPADAPYLDALLALGYSISFARIEMCRQL